MASTIARILSKLRLPIPVALGGTGAETVDDAPFANKSNYGFTIIYPNGGTAAAPATAALNATYTSPNPFPGYTVHVEVEVKYTDGKWYNCVPFANGAVAAGIVVGQVDDNIICRTSITNLIYTAGGYVNSTCPGVVQSGALPFRVKVWKLGQ